MNTHDTQYAPLGNSFSEWSQLTEEYTKGMEALRRREPGASSRMMEIAGRLNAFQQPIAPPPTASASVPLIPSTAKGAAHSSAMRASNFFMAAQGFLGFRKPGARLGALLPH